MGFFKRRPDLSLSSRIDTVTVPAKVDDFATILPVAHILTPSEIFDGLGTSKTDGLSRNEAARRLERCGENLLQSKEGVSAWRVLFGQLGELGSLFRSSQCFSQLLANALTLVLLAALALSFGVQDFIEGGVIAAVIVLNTTYVLFRWLLPDVILKKLVLDFSRNIEPNGRWTH